MSFATFSSNPRTQDPVQGSFKKPISAVDIAALKLQVESNYRVSFIYAGSEYDYTVTLQGSNREFQKALLTLFPIGRADIIIGKSKWVS